MSRVSRKQGDPLNCADDNLVAEIERLSVEDLDSLPFGVIRLDADGKVTYFSKAEARQSGFGDRSAVGRDFFADLAPCMSGPELLRKIEAAKTQGTLDISFEHMGDFEDAERDLRVRIVSASDTGLWIFNERSN